MSSMLWRGVIVAEAATTVAGKSELHSVWSTFEYAEKWVLGQLDSFMKTESQISRAYISSGLNEIWDLCPSTWGTLKPKWIKVQTKFNRDDGLFGQCLCKHAYSQHRRAIGGCRGRGCKCENFMNQAHLSLMILDRQQMDDSIKKAKARIRNTKETE